MEAIYDDLKSHKLQTDRNFNKLWDDIAVEKT